jgi:hypothetical protein
MRRFLFAEFPAVGGVSMISTSNPSTTSPVFAGWPMSPLDFLNRLMPAAPRVFEQPINPGWTFGNLISVTEQNSSDPATELNIVASHSYGRQLGRVIDAVAELIGGLPQSAQQSPAFAQLIDLRDKINEIKAVSATRRLDRLAADLDELKKTNAAEYQRVAEKLRTILDR